MDDWQMLAFPQHGQLGILVCVGLSASEQQSKLLSLVDVFSI